MAWTQKTHMIAATCVLLLVAGCPAGGDDDVDDDDSAADDDDTGADDDATTSACNDLECDENAWCDDSEDVAECVCNPGYTGDGFECEEMPSSLEGMRLEMPCVPGHTGYSCAPQAMEFDEVAELEGGMAAIYLVNLRFRGVVEQNEYSGGTQDGLWYDGGAAVDDTYNIYSLTVSEPAATYFLNAGSAGIEHCWAIDYTHTIEAKGGAEITLHADNQDYALIVNQDENGDPIVIPDIAPYPEPFDGQFIQVDVLSVTLADR